MLFQTPLRASGSISAHRHFHTVSLTYSRHSRWTNKAARQKCLALFPNRPQSAKSRPLIQPIKSRNLASTTWAVSPDPIRTEDRYDAVVVGAGPAGVTVMGNLLEKNIGKILWIDPEFSGGRVNKFYREVPSNTNVDRFVLFADAVAPFRSITSGEASSNSKHDKTLNRADKLQFMRTMDQQKGCELGKAADMVIMLTEGLRNMPGVRSDVGRVQEATLDESTGIWRVSYETGKESRSVQVNKMILCHGSSPVEGPLPVAAIPTLHLDVALSPTRLQEIMKSRGPTTVSVIGASHSAILVLRNLYHLAASAKPDLRIRWFTRHALRYAKFMDGWILRDNTGLKGEAAEWARDNLEPEAFKESDVRNYVEAINYDRGEEQSTFKQHLPGSDLVVQAIGYQRNELPALKTTDGRNIELDFNHETGMFHHAGKGRSGNNWDSAPIPGIYGAGIAWPQRVVDPHGNVEYAVGFFKFMKFVKGVMPGWTS